MNLDLLVIRDQLAAAQRRPGRGIPQATACAIFFATQSRGWPQPLANVWRRYLLHGRNHQTCLNRPECVKAASDRSLVREELWHQLRVRRLAWGVPGRRR